MMFKDIGPIFERPPKFEHAFIVASIFRVILNPIIDRVKVNIT